MVDKNEKIEVPQEKKEVEENIVLDVGKTKECKLYCKDRRICT